MRIALVNAVSDFGSTGKLCRDIETYSNQNGNDAVIFCAKAQDGKNAVGTSSDLEMKLSSFLGRITGMQCVYSYFSTKRLIKELDRFAPDVVHLHNLHGNYVSVPMLLKYLEKTKTPVAVTLHDCWFFTGKCTHFTEAGCGKWKTECRDCPQLKKDIPSWLFDFTNKMHKQKKQGFMGLDKLGVIGVSDWITESAKQSFLGQADEIKAIYNWIDKSIFYPRLDARRSYGIKDDDFVVLFISGKWHKGTSKLASLKRIISKVKNCKIVVIGEIEDECDLGDNAIRFNYVSDRNELAKLYSLADVYVHLSVEDTFGMVIAEAMSCGTPAIVFDSTACPELILSGCGYVVPLYDIDAVVSKIEQIKADGKQRYFEACIDSSSRFDYDSRLSDTVDFYTSLTSDTSINKHNNYAQ